MDLDIHISGSEVTTEQWWYSHQLHIFYTQLTNLTFSAHYQEHLLSTSTR